MAASSSSDIGHIIINQKLDSLRETLDSILRIEEFMSKGKSLDAKQRNILHSKDEVVVQIDELEQLSHKISSRLHHVVVPFKPDQTRSNSRKKTSTFEPRDKSRYLCIWDGCVIHCLDLKQSECGRQLKDDALELSNVPPLPKISSLNLLDEGLSVSMGLFKLGSEVYMIGGQHFPGIKKNPKLWGSNLFNSLYREHGVQGSSCAVYRLSLLPDSSLSLSECSDVVRPMNKPKVWPIVEKLNDQIHVIESLPVDFGHHCPDGIPSYEILDISVNHPPRGWIENSPLLRPSDETFDQSYTWRHLAVGDRIYAMAHCDATRFLVFDSKTNKCKLHKMRSCRDYRDVKHVADLFSFGLGWGARGFLHGGLYVVIAVGSEWYPAKHKVLVAYLATPTGQVLFYQILPDFFDGFKQLFNVSQGTLINVDEQGKTMCVVLQIKATRGCREEFLFISTFTMKEVADARSLVSGDNVKRQDIESDSSDDEGQTSEGRDDDDDYGDEKPVEVKVNKLPESENKEFVKVVVKQRHVYKREECLGAEAGLGKRVDYFQACFL